MGVGLSVGFDYYELGAGSFLYSFFSTVACRLEGRHWGSRFPKIMDSLYYGGLDYEELDAARQELEIIREELKAFPPSQVVWDFGNPSKRPPWGDDISPDITDLSLYFVTSDGEDFFEQCLCAIQDAKGRGCSIELE